MKPDLVRKSLDKPLTLDVKIHAKLISIKLYARSLQNMDVPKWMDST